MEFNFKEFCKKADFGEDTIKVLVTERVDTEKACSLLNPGRIASLDIKTGDSMSLKSICRESWPHNFVDVAPRVTKVKIEPGSGDESASAGAGTAQTDVRSKGNSAELSTTKSLKADKDLEQMVKTFLGLSDSI